MSRSLSAAICVNRPSTAEEINNNCRAWSVLSDAIDVRLSASWLTHRQLKRQMLGPSAPGCWQHVFQFVYHKSKKTKKKRGEEITKICSMQQCRVLPALFFLTNYSNTLTVCGSLCRNICNWTCTNGINNQSCWMREFNAGALGINESESSPLGGKQRGTNASEWWSCETLWIALNAYRFKYECIRKTFESSRNFHLYG